VTLLQLPMANTQTFANPYVSICFSNQIKNKTKNDNKETLDFDTLKGIFPRDIYATCLVRSPYVNRPVESDYWIIFL